MREDGRFQGVRGNGEGRAKKTKRLSLVIIRLSFWGGGATELGRFLCIGFAGGRGMWRNGRERGGNGFVSGFWRLYGHLVGMGIKRP